YTGSEIRQVVTQVQLPGELFANDGIGVSSQLLFVGGRNGINLSPQELLNFKYYNNVNVGTATIAVSVDNDLLREFNRTYTASYLGAVNHAFLFAGTTNLHYQIQKSKLTVSSISGNIVQKEYDGNVYSYSTWATSEISGLEGFNGAVFTGTISTNSPNVSLYVYGQGSSKLYWSSPWRVTLHGSDITSNFDVEVKFMVRIVPMEVEIVWTKSVNPIDGSYQPVNVLGTYEFNGETKPLIEYPYIGGPIQPYGVARNITSGAYIPNSLCPVVAKHMDNNQVGTYPYGTEGTYGTYGIYAYINGSAAQNYLLKEKNEQGEWVTPQLHLGTTTTLTAIQAYYRVGKGLITININETYKISPNEDFWSRSWGFGGNVDNLYPINVSLNGLGANSYFLGSLKTSSDALGVYTANFDSREDSHLFNETADNQISWANLLPGVEGRFYHNFSTITIDYIPSSAKPYLIYNPTLKVADETQYYDVVVNARIQILYNDFNLSYFVGPEDDQYLTLRNPNYLVYPRTITQTTDGNAREYEYIEYMVDGSDYRLTVEDWTAFTRNYPDYEVHYYKDEGATYTTEGPIFKEIGEFVYGVSLSARHYNTLRKNIRVKTVKSNVSVGSLSKVYDREPIDPIKDGKILKIGKDQLLSITFTYFDANGSQLMGAPKDVGSYSVIIYAPEGQYFNEYNRTHNFTISRRKLRITIGGSKLFDQDVYSYAPLSGDLTRTEENPNEGLLPGDEFVGTVHTASFIPGTYTYDGTGTYSFIWSPAWAVLYDVDSSDVSNNYELVFRGKYEIKPLQFEYHAEGYEGDYDGDFHTGSVEILYPTPAYYAPALSPNVDVRYSVSSLSESSSGWLANPPVFADPGVYTLYYKISATYFQTVIGSVRIKINPLQIEYIDPATQDTDGADDYWTVEYTGRSYTYQITVISPEFSAVVYYSLDGNKYTTEAPMFINYGLHDVWYKIEAPYHETVGPVHRIVRIRIDINDPNDDDPAANAKLLDDEDYYANFFNGEYDGQPHTVDADFTAAFKAQPDVDWTRVLYSLDSGNTWTEEKPYFTELGRYLVTVRFSAKGYKDEMLQGYIAITGMQFNIQTIPYEGVFDGKYHMIGLKSNTDQIRFDEDTKTYFYKNSKMSEEIELKFSYTTNPNVVGSNSGWLPTVGLVDGVPTQLGMKDVDTYAVYARIQGENFEPLVIDTYTTLRITKLEHPEVSMDSPQQFEYSKAAINSSK
ncbi:MAG: hypothetical protein K2J85_05050, partial [Anaeroplasmataceae bacterium]|nr:hypothetical protein [Anaeroplasmataceae bacterium]